MDAAPTGREACAATGDLSLREAATLYDVTVRTLTQQLRSGRLDGYKVRGVTGREWRVAREALHGAGFRERPAPVGLDAQAVVLQLEQELAAVKRAAAAERRRADDLDRRLGHAMLETGRLRAALAAATGQVQPTEAELDPDAARWLIATITGGTTLPRSSRSVLDTC